MNSPRAKISLISRNISSNLFNKVSARPVFVKNHIFYNYRVKLFYTAAAGTLIVNDGKNKTGKRHEAECFTKKTPDVDRYLETIVRLTIFPPLNQPLVCIHGEGVQILICVGCRAIRVSSSSLILTCYLSSFKFCLSHAVSSSPSLFSLFLDSLLFSLSLSRCLSLSLIHILFSRTGNSRQARQPFVTVLYLNCSHGSPRLDQYENRPSTGFTLCISCTPLSLSLFALLSPRLASSENI